MKRLHYEEQMDAPKRAKSSLAWLGTGLQQLKSLSSIESWHAAKQVVAEGGVELRCFVEDDQLDCVCVQAHVGGSNVNAAAFPHIKPLPDSAATQSVAVELFIHSRTGQILDADTSCCPGGFQPVLGSFCPHAAAALLLAAKQARAPASGAVAPLVSLSARSCIFYSAASFLLA